MQKNGSSAIENRFDSLKASVKNLVDAGGQRAGQFKDKAINVKDSFVENSEAALNRAGGMIKAHPFAALGIAFGVGYIVMRVFKK